jgi:hypothetical protein
MIEYQIDTVGTCTVGRRRTIQTPAVIRLRNRETRLDILSVVRTQEEGKSLSETMERVRQHPTGLDLRVYRSWSVVPDLSGYPRIESLQLTTYSRGVRYEGRLPASARELYLEGEHDIQTTGEIGKEIVARRDKELLHLCVLGLPSEWSVSIFDAVGQSRVGSLDLNGFDRISERSIENLVSARGLSRIRLGVHTEQVLHAVANSRSLHDWRGRVSLVLRTSASSTEEAAKLSPIVRDALRSQRRRRRRARLEVVR